MWLTPQKTNRFHVNDRLILWLMLYEFQWRFDGCTTLISLGFTTTSVGCNCRFLLLGLSSAIDRWLTNRWWRTHELLLQHRRADSIVSRDLTFGKRNRNQKKSLWNTWIALTARLCRDLVWRAYNRWWIPNRWRVDLQEPLLSVESDACGEPSRGQENALWKRFSDPLSEGSPTTIESTTERVNHVNDWKWIHEPFQSILKLWPNESKAKVKAWIGSWMNDLQTWPSARLYFHLLSGERIRRSRYERRSCWTSFPSFFLVSLGKMSTRISMIDAQLHERHVESDRYLSTIDVSLGSWLERWANLRS